MRLWSSVKGQAERVAFEADKRVRINREESDIKNARKEIEARHLELAQAALALHNAGALDEPRIASLAQQIAALEVTILEHEQLIATIRAEQLETSGEATSETEA